MALVANRRFSILLVELWSDLAEACNSNYLIRPPSISNELYIVAISKSNIQCRFKITFIASKLMRLYSRAKHNSLESDNLLNDVIFSHLIPLNLPPTERKQDCFWLRSHLTELLQLHTTVNHNALKNSLKELLHVFLKTTWTTLVIWYVWWRG